MYPQVTQFETRQRLLLDEFRLQEERRLARLPDTTPPGHTLAATSTAPAVLTRVVRALSSR
jgi:hypothetical protein